MNTDSDNNQSNEFNQALLMMLKRDSSAREAQLKHDEADLKHKKRKTWLIVGAIVMGPLLYWGGVYTLFGEKGISGDYAALVRIHGEIGADKPVSAMKIIPALKEAFDDDDAKGVVLEINSPGGSPVQSSLIHDAIIRLRNQYPNKKVVAVGEDSVTSGAYFIATGAPEIYVNKSTIAGSIGVISTGFGINLEKLTQYGVERRVLASGEFKGRNDMFQTLTEQDKQKTQTIMEKIHQHFIDSVNVTRQGKIKVDPKLVFSGDYWTGEDALAMGLVDGFSDLPSIIKKKFGVDMVADYTPRPGFFDNMKTSFGVKDLTEVLKSIMSEFQTAPSYRVM